MPQGTFKLSDDEFFSSPWKNQDLVEAPFIGPRTEALLVDAPHKISLDVRKTAPILAIRLSRTANEISAPFRKFAIVVASDLDSGRNYANLAVEPPSRSVEEPEEREVSPTAMTGGAYEIDLRERLNLPWRTSHLVVTLVLRDQLTDSLEVELGFSPGGYQDPEVEKHRLAERLRQPLPLVEPAPALERGSLPAYGKVPGAPKIPDAAGLLLAAPRVLVASSESTVRLEGSFRLPVPPHLFVQPGERSSKLAQQFGDGPLPLALVPILLVITSSKYPAPLVLQLTVPAWEVDDARMATGQFALDLDSVTNVRRAGRTFFAYAFSGAQRAGPLPIAVVSEEN